MYAFHLLRHHYTDAILVVLERLGGSGRIGAVQDAVRRELDRYMTEVDLGSVPSNPNEVRWRNDARWARNQLVQEGLLQGVHEAGWGIWSLTARGRAAVPAAKARLGGPSSAGRRLADDARAIRIPTEGARQLTFLAEVFRRAHDTPVGDRSHPALYDVVATLERLLQAKLAPPPVLHPPPQPASAYPRISSRAWTPPVPTATVTPNHMDVRRMLSFIEGPWRAAVLEMQQLPPSEKFARARDIDVLASLPAVTCLVAARSGWLPLPQAAALATRAVHRVMTEGLRVGGLVGGLPLAAGGEFAVTMREGLFHRTLTGWVQHLDAAADETLTLRTEPLRTWLSAFRGVLGDPTDVGPRKVDPMWAWLFEQDPTYEPPRDGSAEEAARELAGWLASTSHGAQDAPSRGALLWHPLVGWAVALGNSRNRFDPNFSAHVLVTSEDKAFKFFTKTGWIDVDRTTAVSGNPVMREAAIRVGEVARRDWGAGPAT